MSANLRSLVTAIKKKNAKITIPLQCNVSRCNAMFQDVREDILDHANTLNLATANSRNIANMIIKRK